MTLVRAGYAVVVYGSCTDFSAFAIDRAFANRHGFRFESVLPISHNAFVNRLRNAFRRVRGRFGRYLFELLGIENHWQLGPLGSEMLTKAISSSADYYIAHLEQAIWVAEKLIGMGKRVGVDMEDWYSEDLLPEARAKRPIELLRNLEGHLLKRGAYALCTSQAMSAALAKAYDCSPPVVIYNAFQWSERTLLDGLYKDKRESRTPSIHWFSQTIGPGRGLEDLLAALPHLDSVVEVHLRGHAVAGFEAWLTAHVPDAWRRHVFVHDVVSNEQLLSRISEHDIGFAGEMKYSKSRDLTVTNKILHYLLAGLAVVASDTAGQREVAEQAGGAVLLYPSGDALALAARLNELLGSPEKLSRSKAAALRAAEETFCWERQENLLLETIARAMSGSNDN